MSFSVPDCLPAHLLLPTLITSPLYARLPPPIPNTALIPILLTRARTFSFSAAFAFDACGTGGCACWSSIANATSTAVGTRQCGGGQRVHGTGGARGPYLRQRSEVGGLVNRSDHSRVIFGESWTALPVFYASGIARDTFETMQEFISENG